MCSVCWQWGGADDSPLLKVIFNRDEQRTRSIALPPEVIDVESTQVLMPVDPARGGTWIATNQFGLTVALLNKYEVLPEKAKDYASRGHVVRSLSASKDLDEVEQLLKELTKDNIYPAFSLLIWDLNQKVVKLWSWDEQVLVEKDIELPFFTSSSWKTSEVQRYRIEAYQDAISGDKAIEDFMKTSTSGKEKWSVLMQREKTRTVSGSEISLYSGLTEFLYRDYNSNEISEHSLENLLK